MPSIFIGFQCAFGTKLRDILYGERTKFNGHWKREAKPERLGWAGLVRHFSPVFVGDALKDEAHSFVAAHGVCGERGSVHDQALRNRFFHWLREIAEREKRWERLSEWNRTAPPRPPSAKRHALEIRQEILRLTKDERAKRIRERSRSRPQGPRSAEARRVEYIREKRNNYAGLLARNRKAVERYQAKNREKVLEWGRKRQRRVGSPRRVARRAIARIAS